MGFYVSQMLGTPGSFLHNISLIACLRVGCVATSAEVYSSRASIHKLGFSRASVLSWVRHPFQALLCIWTNDSRLTDGGRLFPSLYFLIPWLRTWIKCAKTFVWLNCLNHFLHEPDAPSMIHWSVERLARLTSPLPL